MPTLLKRRRIRTRDHDRCFYCEERSDTIDHLIPRSAGGMNDDGNLVGCCRRCNVAKDNMKVLLFITRVMPKLFDRTRQRTFWERLQRRLAKLRPDLAARLRYDNGALRLVPASSSPSDPAADTVDYGRAPPHRCQAPRART